MSLPYNLGRRLTQPRPVSICIKKAQSLLMPFSCSVERHALPHRLADWSRAYSDHTYPILVLDPFVGRHHDLLFGSSLPNMEDDGLAYDSWHNCGGT